MSAQVTLNLSDKFYERIEHYAQTRHQGIAQSITEFLENSFPMVEVPNPSRDYQTEQLEALDREKEAYIQLHPQLKKTHFGHYVATYHGQLIDKDSDLGRMIERVRDKLPNQVVLMTQVGDEHTRTIMKRGNRIIRNDV
jgi:hypothetical protein